MTPSAYTRFAHSEGYVPLCHVPDGAGGFLIATAGSDGELRLWTDIDGENPRCHHIGDKLTALCLHASASTSSSSSSSSSQRIIVGTDYNAAAAFLLPSLEADGVVSRFTAELSDVSARGHRVAAASCDMNVRVVSDDGRQQCRLPEFRAPVLCAQLAPPGGEVLLTACCDGAVTFWDVGGGAAAVQIVCHAGVLAKCNSVETSETRARCDWRSDGKVAAVPSGTQVRLYKESSKWQENGRLSCPPKIEEQLAACAFSPCDKFLAACSLTGALLRWRMQDASCVLLCRSDDAVPMFALSWHPSGKLLAFTDTSGQLGVIDPRVDDQKEVTAAPTQELLDLDSLEDAIDDDDENDILEAAMRQDKDFDDVDDVPAAEDDDQDDDDNTISLSKLKADAGFSEETADKDVILPTPAEPSIGGSTGLSERVGGTRSRPVQESFQPGATPVHLERRFLMWNSVGAVIGHSEDGSVDSLDVEFHDTSVHHAIHLANIHGHVLADLSEAALVLASLPSASSEDDEDGRAVLQCVLLAPLDSAEREWLLRLSAGEKPLGLCVGDSWLALACQLSSPASWILRTLSLAGVQLHVVSLCSRPLCVSASGRSLLLLQTSIDAPTLLVWSVDVAGGPLVTANSQPQPVPAGSGRDVVWAGLSDDSATPCIMDSTGTLHVMGERGVWTPLRVAGVDGRKQHVFVVSVSEAAGEVSGVLCRGTRYPAVLPRPVLSRLTLSLPYCDVDSERGRMEQEAGLVRWRRSFVSSSSSSDSENERCLAVLITKLFALACKSQQQQRALDLAAQLADVNTLRALAGYANKQRLTQLVERLVDLMDSRERQEADRQYESERQYEANENGQSQQSVDMFAQSSCDQMSDERVGGDCLTLPPPVLSGEEAVRPAVVVGVTPTNRNPFRCQNGGQPLTGGASRGPRGVDVFDNIRSPSVLADKANKRPLADFQLKPAKITRKKHSTSS